MSKRIVTLGTWDGKPIQWIVLKESKLGSVVINTIIDGQKTDIFLLSKEEAENWMTSNERRGTGTWLLRSRYDSNGVVVYYDSGRFGRCWYGDERYIRPAFILDL